MPDFYRASPAIAWLRPSRIPNESTETKNCYYSLNRELRWLWNSVYYATLLNVNLTKCIIFIIFISLSLLLLRVERSLISPYYTCVFAYQNDPGFIVPTIHFAVPFRQVDSIF